MSKNKKREQRKDKTKKARRIEKTKKNGKK